MRKMVFCFPFFLLLLTVTMAQNNFPPAYEVNSDIPIYATIDHNYWQICEDEEGKWTIGDVMKLAIAAKFHSGYTNLNGVDYSIHFYWFRYRIRNVINKEVKICLTNATNADQSDFYVIDQSKQIHHYATGYLYPWYKKDGLKKVDLIPIVLNPGEEILVYNRLENFYYFNKPDSFSITIENTEKAIQEKYIADETETFAFSYWFAGLLVCAVFINFFFYTVVKEKVFVYYSLFLLYFSYQNYIQFFIKVIFTNRSPVPFYVSNVLVLTAGIPLFIQFLRYFLKTFVAFPKWDFFLKAIAIFSPLAYICSFFIEPHLGGEWNGVAESIATFFFDVGLIMILVTIMLYRGSTDKLIKLLILSAFPAALFWALGFTAVDLYKLLKYEFHIKDSRVINRLEVNLAYINIACVIWLVITFSWILIMRFMQLRKENVQQAIDKERLAKEKEFERRELIEKQKVELEKQVKERTTELRQSLEELKSTQAQLIQSEKMASLGQLTSGIAHEIQNPLNFVNNFSEVNKELIAELKVEIDRGDLEEVKAIANDIEENEEKIIHHGKRADSIVKGMLQHSRANTGKKELTDINALMDECVRLSYHGMRAKDKEFNAAIKTDLDDSIGKLNVVPQDISRVLLNLFNNAFYAVHEKKAQLNGAFEPAIFICTKKQNDRVEIYVKDNGNGIPQNIIDKIFQPFFTTKPTGQGTGLGLSLSYDIIKAHGGEIKVESKEGEGSEFYVLLPV